MPPTWESGLEWARPNDSEPEVSVVIPCLNEERSIGACLESISTTLATRRISAELVVADNGSTDASAAIAESSGARVVRVAQRGYGWAIREGIAQARGEFIVLCDADGQHDARDIPALIEALRAGNELVVGNRFGSKIAPGAMTWSHRHLGNPLISGLVRLLFHPGVHDAQCGLRGLRRQSVPQLDLRTTGFELCPEMVVKAARHGMRIAEIPITVLPAQRDRPPHLRTIRDGWRHLVFILMCSPNWLFVAPGAALLLLGIAFTSWLSIGTQTMGRLVLTAKAESFGVMLAMFGFEILSVGVFARVFSYSEPRETHHRSVTRALTSMRLEQGLMLGGALAFAGLIGDLVQIVPWAFNGFGALNAARAIVFWSLWLVLGIQICVTSVFLSMIGISRGTWLGTTLHERRSETVGGSVR